MNRPILAALALSTLACGGLVDGAKQAAADRVEQELTERALEGALGADDIQIDGDRVTLSAEGTEVQAGVGTALPEGFPLAFPPQIAVMGVATYKAADQDLTTITGSVNGDLAVAKEALAAFEAELKANGWETTMNQDVDAGTGLMSMRLAEKGDEQITVSVTGDAAEYAFLVGWIVKHTP